VKNTQLEDEQHCFMQTTKRSYRAQQGMQKNLVKMVVVHSISRFQENVVSVTFHR